jgi:hypothetical protein
LFLVRYHSLSGVIFFSALFLVCSPSISGVIFFLYCF